MKTLLLLRHAKSSWEERDQPDILRPLKKRGRKDCTAMAAYMAEHIAPVDVVLCSPATRTRETWERIADPLDWGRAARIEDDLYAALAETLIEHIRGLDEPAERCLLIGHNPAIQETALALAGGGNAETRARAERKFPTAALAELQFDAPHWQDIAPGSGRLLRFVVPRELMQT